MHYVDVFVIFLFLLFSWLTSFQSVPKSHSISGEINDKFIVFSSVAMCLDLLHCKLFSAKFQEAAIVFKVQGNGSECAL